jgi:hypothetical protein
MKFCAVEWPNSMKMTAVSQVAFSCFSVKLCISRIKFPSVFEVSWFLYGFLQLYSISTLQCSESLHFTPRQVISFPARCLHINERRLLFYVPGLIKVAPKSVTRKVSFWIWFYGFEVQRTVCLVQAVAREWNTAAMLCLPEKSTVKENSDNTVINHLTNSHAPVVHMYHPPSF